MADPFGIPDDVNRMPFGAASPAEDAARTGGVGQFLAKLGSSVLGGLVKSAAGPGALMQPNPYPEGSEEAFWYEGQREKGARDWAAGTALNLAGVNAPFAPAGAAGIFGGRLAKTADQGALRTAEEMAAAGADRRAIWDKTGWFQGGDGKWRFEIPDLKADMGFDHRVGGLRNEFGPVKEQLEHSDLYAAYPDLGDVTAYVRRTEDGTAGGSHVFDPDGVAMEEINVRAPNTPTARKIALHEAQHAVQVREGFSPGGSPAMFSQGAEAELARDALHWRREMERHPGTMAEKDAAAAAAFEKAGAADWVPSKEAREIALYPEDNPSETLSRLVELYGLDKRVTPYTPKELYQSIPGELEAANVEARRNFTDAQRRDIPPWETETGLGRVASSSTLNSLFGSRVGLLEK